ncbi:MAG: hypothetical protein ACRDRJ_10040 [Streptosporangiaceae bacterium]
MVIILLAVAAVAVLVPVVCLVLVSIASLREDGAHSLSYKPAGAMQAAARRMLGFHGDALTERPGAARSAGTAGFAAGAFPGDPTWTETQANYPPEFIDNNGRPADPSLNDHLDLRHLVG